MLGCSAFAAICQPIAKENVSAARNIRRPIALFLCAVDFADKLFANHFSVGQYPVISMLCENLIHF